MVRQVPGFAASPPVRDNLEVARRVKRTFARRRPFTRLAPARVIPTALGGYLP